ncbi:unnamed protein product [Phytophthora fragariaefolia]|uniref:Unnamed protein product n=1 Tax=Phytophthora fragariaefolia TaxID=1490495 RepID=A0A9W7CKV9_9STRA|nr:unnamed protein product [Phytophthora fragariaefolia]
MLANTSRAGKVSGIVRKYEQRSAAHRYVYRYLFGTDGHVASELGSDGKVTIELGADGQTEPEWTQIVFWDTNADYTYGFMDVAVNACVRVVNGS